MEKRSNVVSFFNIGGNMKYNFKKKYGQNFLINNEIPLKIANSIMPNEDDLILEIGVGIGSLTKYLLELNTKYMGYEIDLETKAYLNNVVSLDSIIFDDFLTRDIKSDISNIKHNNLYIMGNLPYYITTPIITKIINSNINEKEIVIMIQDEVAKRLCSKPNSKEYGYITALLNCYYEIEYLFKVDKNNFKPIPKVTSAVIKLVRKEKVNIDYNKLDSFLKNAFKYKRKTLKNNLTNYDLTLVDKILNKYGLNINCRAEQISYEIYLEIVSSLI